jgi:hypothetical protein
LDVILDTPIFTPASLGPEVQLLLQTRGALAPRQAQVEMTYIATPSGRYNLPNILTYITGIGLSREECPEGSFFEK